ncbi:MAG: hypothetical protein WC026_16355 [Hyphomicrobium sp.]|uniref:hypothetical protein n=1 Tax=Hyphomicrobium sp. TaxID=82 RepID=UPI003565FD33
MPMSSIKEGKKFVLIGAQSWAFGPAGKASAVAHSFQKLGLRTCFVGSSTSLDLCKNSGHFDDLIEVSSAYDYLNLQEGNFSAVVSVMDPYLAVWAKNRNLPLYYIDSMSWFWNWEDKSIAEDFIGNIEKKKLADSFKCLDAFEPDTRQLVAHQISQLVFSQGNPQTVPVTEKKSKNIGSVIDLSYRENIIDRDTVVISLSGGISPVNSIESAVRYANMIVDLVLEERSLDFFSAKRFVITGHPEVIKKVNKPNKVGVEFVSLSHPDFLRVLNRAVVVFVPCGFTTIYEALAYRVPVAFLPENHNGHVYEYLIITDGLVDREDIFPNTLFTLSSSSLDYIRPIDDSMNLIDIYTKEYLNNTYCRENYRQKIDNIFRLLSDRDGVLKRQTEAIMKLIPDFEGADRIARNLVANLL